jgi:ribosomal protein L11 methylase PrmA
MLELARVTKDDVVYDLGSGDGRIVIMAAQRFGARGVGVEIDPHLVWEAHENAQRAGVADRVHFLVQDLFATDLRAATVVTLYLMQSVNLELRPKLWRELRPGTRVVSHDFHMGEWPPEQVVRVGGSVIYAWTIPASPGTQP